MTAADVPFVLPPGVRAGLATTFRGMTIEDVAGSSPGHGFTIAGGGPDHLLLRHDSRGYLRLALGPDRRVHRATVFEGDEAAELDRRLWFTFRGFLDKVGALLEVGAAVAAVVDQLRALAPISLDHLTSVYKPDLGSIRLYHFVGGGVIGLEVDPRGVVTAGNVLPPKVGQGTVIALEAQDRASALAWDEPRTATGLRAALDDVAGRGVEIVGLRELAGDTIEITGRSAAGTRRYRYAVGAGPT